MDYRKFDNTYVVRIDKDEEILEKVEELALKENITLAHVSALGAVKEFTIGVSKPTLSNTLQMTSPDVMKLSL